MFGISFMQFAAVLSGIVAGGLFVFGLFEFFKKESEWHRGTWLWIIIAFLGFVAIAFVSATQVTGAFGSVENLMTLIPIIVTRRRPTFRGCPRGKNWSCIAASLTRFEVAHYSFRWNLQSRRDEGTIAWGASPRN